MKIVYSYRSIEAPETLEQVLGRCAAKIEKLLQTYDPDLLQLHGAFEKQPHRPEYLLSLNLSLPTGRLHANATGADPFISVRKGFSELARQIKKHQSRLRKDYEWKRKRGRAEQALA